MDRTKTFITAVTILLIALGAFAQQSSTPPAPAGNTTAPASNISTIRGCLDGQRGNYIVIEDKTGLVYVLKGVGNKLDSHLHHQVEVKGRVRPGIIKTGINPSKSGSNPSDTARGVDGVPLEVADPQADVRTIAKHCRAADQQ